MTRSTATTSCAPAKAGPTSDVRPEELRVRRCPGGPDDDRRGDRFGLVVGVESIAIVAVVASLEVTGQPHLIPAAICLVVGLHFVPLATMFDLRLYLGTAVALCLVDLATLVLVPITGISERAWQALPGFGAAISLWITGGLLPIDSLRVDAA